MRVLVTGATGYVGRAATAALAGHEVVQLPRTIDLLDSERACSAVADVGATHLLHLAWDVTPGSYWSSDANHRWAEASQALFHAFAEAGGERILGVGTCAEYAWTRARLDADAPLTPASIYGRAKLATARGLEAIDISSCWARLFFSFGPHEHPARLVPSVIRALLDGERAACTDGEQKRDFLFVDDVGRALATLLASDVRGAANVSSGTAVAVRDLVGRIGHQLDREHLIDFGARPRSADDPAELYGPPLVLDRLGFSPAVALDEGIARSIAYWQSTTS